MSNGDTNGDSCNRNLNSDTYSNNHTTIISDSLITEIFKAVFISRI